MQQYILDQEQIETLLQGLQTAYGHCKEVQQQYVANLEAQHMESPETAMEVVEDLENFAHMLMLLGKQWEEVRSIQAMVQDHYLFDMIQSMEDPMELEPVADEGVEGYDVGVALGVDLVMSNRWQGGETSSVETEESSAISPSQSTSFMGLFSTAMPKEEPKQEELQTSQWSDDESWDGWDDVSDDSLNPSELEIEERFVDLVEQPTKKEKKRCKHCTENSPIPEERDKCCIVKQEKKKKKEKSKDKSKHKKEAPSVDKWAKKLSKWERYAEEHGDAWTEKVLQKVAKKAEKKAEKRGMKAVFKKHKLDRLATLSKED